MSFWHWKVDVFQLSRDDPVFVKYDKSIKVSRSLFELLLLHILTVLTGLENLVIVVLII